MDDVRNNTNNTNVIYCITFYCLTIISNERVTSPIGVLLAAAKPNEQCVSALKQRRVINYIIPFRRFNDVCRRRNEWLYDR
ncbi:Uncharacterised protein [Enterobacter ludwigii]|nr:hypothetical protein EcloH_1827 [Enterobacter ludwigii]CAH0164863.1 hypothetical protein SRABI45_00880 [Enterobacter ludwigii]VAG34778.1 Uncharacterised protein [Enterobacter ludwigii]VAG76926.1 Uncharacterised protein [Enterobacter ludwigii]